jgi:hypothetical protein
MADQPAKKRSPVAMFVILGVLLFCCVSSAALGTIGYTSFQDFLVRSKTTEASSNLRNLFQLSASYYAQDRFGLGAASADLPTACTVGPATSSNVPGEQKSVVDWSSESPSFSSLGFSVADPIYYQYEIAGAPGHCGHLPDTPVYSLRAHGDLDGDGERSLHEIAVGSNAEGELYRAAGIYTEDELE